MNDGSHFAGLETCDEWYRSIWITSWAINESSHKNTYYIQVMELILLRAQQKHTNEITKLIQITSNKWRNIDVLCWFVVSTYPLLRRYQHLFLRYKIDLNSLKNNHKTARFYKLIGINNGFIIKQLMNMFPITVKYRVHHCLCKEVITFSDLYELSRLSKNGLQNVNIHETYRLIYGAYIRVFCLFCVNYKVKRCRLSFCNRFDIEKVFQSSKLQKL